MIVLQMTADELTALIRREVEAAQKASQPKPEPAKPPTALYVGLLEIGPLIGRPWGRTTARQVVQMPGFPKPAVKGRGGRRYRFPTAPTLLFLRQHEAVLPPARPHGKAGGDTAGPVALPCA